MRRLPLALLGLTASVLGCQTGGSGRDGESLDPTNSGVESESCRAIRAPRAPLALLTRREYDNTIDDLLRDRSRPAREFPPENQVLGFNNFTAAHLASPLLVEKYLQAAETIAARAVSSRLSEIAPCGAGADVLSCGRAFVRDFGTRAFRRPLEATEAMLFDDLLTRIHSQSGYAAAVEAVLSAMLQSPQFLYRIDSLRAPTPESGAVALSSFELASKLSYFLTGSTPDVELLAAAQADQLRSDDQLTAQAERLLATPRARDTVRAFHDQWLGLDRLPAISRDPFESGGGAQQFGEAWRESLLEFIDYVYWESGDISALFNSTRVYLTPELGPLYGVTVDPSRPLSPVELPDRTGLLTQPGLLALLAHSDQSAPVLRGVFVREQIFCIPVPPPPPTVNAVPPDPDPNATTRERFRIHTEQRECAGCHALIDGIGFGFEAYDQYGKHRTEENGLRIDVSGSVIGTGDPDLDGPYQGTAELSARAASSQRVRECIATNWYRFAFGRMETSEDTCSLDYVKARFEKSGGNLKELLLSITQSVAFRYRPAQAEASE